MKNLKPHQRQTKNWALLLICHFGAMFFAPTISVHAQALSGGYECGVFEKITPDGFQPSQPAYADRFGNRYTEDEMALWNLNQQSNHCDQIEDFTLIFENNQNNPFSNDEIETICDVFDYLSGLITAQSGERAVIRLRKDPALGIGVAAVGTPFFPNQCGLGHSLVHQQLFTGGVNTPQHGLIAVNANISNFYIGPSAGIGLNQVDYYTVILHEALHVMGFGSQITPNGAPAQGFYTLWDLNIVNNDGEHMILSTMPSTNGSCCADYVFNSADFPGMPNLVWNQNCGPANVKFDVAQLPPVNGEYASQDPQTFMNVLSHLDRTCGSEHYVMNSGIPPGADGVQRTLTNAETAILCRLGYQTSGCMPDCIVIAENDGAFFVAQGQSITVDISTLLANDFPSNATFSLMTNCGNTSGIGVTSNGTQIVVQGNDLGVYTFCYSITGCNGLRCDVATVRIVVTNPALAEACENLEDCQINPFVDFEEFGSDEELRQLLTAGNNGFGFAQQSWGGWDNTPDLVASPAGYWFIPCNVPFALATTPSGNQFLRFAMSRNNGINYAEGVSLPLCEPIFPGMSGIVTFIATSSDRCQIYGPEVRAEFSENAPIAGQIVYNNPGISSPSWFVPIVSTVSTNPAFTTYAIQFTNQSEVCWNYLYLSSFTEVEMPGILAAIFIDAVRVEINNDLLEMLDVATGVSPENPCLGDQVNMTIEICNNVGCDGNTFSNPATLVTAQLPPGLTLIPNADFPSLTHLVNEGDIPPGGCVVLTLALQVSSDEAFDGQTLPINLQFNPLAPCFDGATLNAGNVTPMICTSEFACPCTGSNDLNIDAGDAPVDPNQTISGLSVTNTPLGGGQPIQNSYNNSGKCIAVRGHLLIDNDFTLNIDGGEIRMQPGAKIIVKNGATLNMKGINGGASSDPAQRGIHGCEQMWRSIVVEQGGKLNLSGNIIQDAEYAVDVKGGSDMPSFDASNNDFDRNHVGIRVNGAVVQALPFQKNKFRATSILLPVYSSGITNWMPLRSYTGMELTSTAFTVGVSGDMASENLFAGPGLRNGILSVGAFLNVYYAKFTQIFGAINYNQANSIGNTQSGVAIHARSGGKVTVHNSTFGGEGSNGWRAIYVGRCNLEAKWNDMYDITSGIYATPGGQATEITIQENKFRVTLPNWGFGQNAYLINNLSPGTHIKILNNNPIQIKGAGPAILLTNDPNNVGTTTRRVSGNHIYHSRRFYEGIKAENSSNWTMDNNHIFYSGFPSGNIFTQITRGVFLSNSDKCLLRDNEIRATDGSLIGTTMHGIELLGSQRCTLCCNLTDATTVGNFFMGNCDPTYLRHEQLHNHWIGLDCRDIGTVIGDQNWAGNQWLGTYGMLGAWHSGSQANVEGSEFFVEGPQTTTYWPPSREPDDADVWFRQLPGSSNDCSAADALCPNLPPAVAPNGPRDLTENEIRIATGTYASSHMYDQATQREGERSLYREMKTNVSLFGQDAFADQFFASTSTSTIGQLDYVESQFQTLGAVPENDRARLLQIIHDMDSLAQVRNQIDLLYASAQNAADSTVLNTRKTTCFASARSLLMEWSEIRDNAEAALAAEIPGILALNNSIASSDTWVANRKTVNRIYLEAIASGVDTATQQQISDLLAVANQCALEGGDAVLQARAIYNALAEEPLMLNDMEICELGVGERSDKSVAGQNHTAHQVSIAPNPARDVFTLWVQGVEPGEMLRLQVLNANGVLEKELLVANGAAIPSAFNPGLYFCRVYVGEEPADVLKLVIIH
ncbi:MAG: hypothetical protein KIS77_11080 [Saprospiraceae bacterium]|nr:hypothetical protein [Saprospiraceae bacterium]